MSALWRGKEGNAAPLPLRRKKALIHSSSKKRSPGGLKPIREERRGERKGKQHNRIIIKEEDGPGNVLFCVRSEAKGGPALAAL